MKAGNFNSSGKALGKLLGMAPDALTGPASGKASGASSIYLHFKLLSGFAVVINSLGHGYDFKKLSGVK